LQDKKNPLFGADFSLRWTKTEKKSDFFSLDSSF